MKKLYLLLLLTLLPLVANADPVEIDGIYFNLDMSSENKTASVARNPHNYSGDIVIPESVSFEGVTYIVTL